MEDENGYFFRGNITNNYVMFANRMFRIMRVNDDNTVNLTVKYVDSFAYDFLGWFDADGNEFVWEGEDLMARAICHENDHLNGITVLDNANLFYEDMTPEQLKAVQELEDYE